MVNKAILVGRLGSDPETKFAQSGTQITKFSIATSEGYGDKKTTSWFRITTFGKLAEICSSYLKKGMLVYISGRIQVNEWTDSSGVKKKDVDIVCSDLKILSSSHGQIEPEAPEDDVPF